MKNTRKVVIGLSLSLFTLGISPQVSAQFSGLLNAIQKAVPNQQSGGNQSVSSGGKNFSYGDACKTVPFLLGTQDASKFKPEDSVISSEFNVTDLDVLQDQFTKSFKKSVSTSKAFVNANFWKASFETPKIRTYYDSFLAYPEPAVLNELILLSRNNSDKQYKTDALMALVFIHLQAPELSVSKNRAIELYRQVVQTGDSYPKEVFKSRLYAFGEGAPYGEGGSTPNPDATLGYLVSASSIVSSIRSGNGMGGREWDIKNGEEQHTMTALNIMQAYPNLPALQNWRSVAQQAMQIMQAQDAYMRAFANTREAKLLIEVQNLSADASKINDGIINLSKQGNKAKGQLASQQSLENVGKGAKLTYVYTDPKAEQERIKAIANMDNITPEQKKLLVDSQTKRLVAQNILYEVNFKLAADTFSNMRDMVRAAAPGKVMKLTQEMQYQSCIVSDKWERAMRAKDVPKADPIVAAELAGNASKKYGKD